MPIAGATLIAHAGAMFLFRQRCFYGAYPIQRRRRHIGFRVLVRRPDAGGRNQLAELL